MITDLGPECTICGLEKRYHDDQLRGHHFLPPEPSADDWENGYAKGYDRALSQLVELVEFRAPNIAEFVREQAEKLRKEVLNDTPDA